eukprot:1187036-Prorocentrum_minimum.AAC.1
MAILIAAFSAGSNIIPSTCHAAHSRQAGIRVVALYFGFPLPRSDPTRNLKTVHRVTDQSAHSMPRHAPRGTLAHTVQTVHAAQYSYKHIVWVLVARI